VPRRRFCSFCANKVEEIDYKNITMLRGYISDRGKINPRRRSGTCARHQRALAMAIKRARHLAFLPYAPKHIHRMGDVASLGTPKVQPTEAEKSELKAAVAAEAKSPVMEGTPLAEVESPAEETVEAITEESPTEEAVAEATGENPAEEAAPAVEEKES